MPVYEVTQRCAVALEALFAYFRRPANLVALAPPSLHLTLVAGPEVLEAGSRWTVTTRRFGLTARITTEVVDLVEPLRLVEEQREGPFRRWRLERTFVALRPTETEVHERIEYEPPGGLLGLTLTAQRIEADLTEAYRWRQERLQSGDGSGAGWYTDH